MKPTLADGNVTEMPPPPQQMTRSQELTHLHQTR